MAATAKQYTKQIVAGNKLRVSEIQGFTANEVALLSLDGNSSFKPQDGSTVISSDGSISLNSSTIIANTLPSYANDAAAQTGGVEVGELYINSGTGAVTRRLV